MSIWQRILNLFKKPVQPTSPVQATPVPTPAPQVIVEPVVQPVVPVATTPPPTPTQLGPVPVSPPVVATVPVVIVPPIVHDTGAIDFPQDRPWVIGVQKRDAYKVKAGVIYKMIFENPGIAAVSGKSGLVVSPTVNDPAGQSANYRLMLWGQNGPMWYDMGWAQPQPHSAVGEFVVGDYSGPSWLPHLRAGLHVFMFQSDVDSEIWFETRPLVK